MLMVRAAEWLALPAILAAFVTAAAVLHRTTAEFSGRAVTGLCALPRSTGRPARRPDDEPDVALPPASP